MDGLLRLVELHWQVPLLVGLSMLGFGMLIYFIGRSRRRANNSIQDRSVRVGRDNSGIIFTGDLGKMSNSSGDLLTKIGTWASIIGLLITIISIIPLINSWFPTQVK